MTTLRPGEYPRMPKPRASSRQPRDSRPRDSGVAADAYDAAITRWPHEPHAWLGRGNVAYADGDRQAAADAYLRAVMLAPDDAAARNNLAELLLDAGCRDESRKQIERAAALAEGTALVPSVRTAGSASMRRPSRALPVGDRACRTVPEPQALGGTFAFRRNRFIGSYFALESSAARFPP